MFNRFGFIMAILMATDVGAVETNQFHSGVYEQLRLAVAPDGKITGYYREEQGEGVSKTCSFYLRGQSNGDSASLTTWNVDSFPGELRIQAAGVNLKVEHGNEHPGCGMLLPPAIEQGLNYDKVTETEWTELRVISSPKTYFHSKPKADAKLKSYLVKGDVVGVVGAEGDWLQVEYPGTQKMIRGWISNSDLAIFKSGQ
ncbi:SH3 domain-containing protein [Methylomonas fluvii]|uniref:SH3 domain-containing protein n=1 Tax=Methylomonas fluvii TaxID=1854564 RepID=A0ABR9DF26_9GAMM|nr:SH3 domain-containing protein [Methylomonas fluvii]MBD9361694.1 SH3 domain-containing protein [Methylomonas fluvii]